MAKRDKDTITLGSGKLYFQEYSGSVPDRTTICTADNLLGFIKGGAGLEYAEETYEEKDDLGFVSKIITTSEEAKLKCGLLTWNGNTLNVLVDRATVTEADGIRTIKIGGAGNAKGKSYVLCFHYEDAADGDMWVTIVGRNTAGLTLTYATDSGTVLEPEFTAKPQDSDGTLILIEEEIPALIEEEEENPIT